MLCEICKTEEATVHLTQVVDGSIKKVHLCEACSQKHGFDLQGPISITDILLGMGEKSDEPGSPAVPAREGKSERSCPRCHMRRSDFKKTGRFGCADCYDTFAEDLPKLLKAMHRNDVHKGKIPERERVRVTAMHDLSDLQEDLEAAIAEEQYETAAEIRDKIKACRDRLDSAEGAGDEH